MFILGLTGSIGMGKSTTATMFRRFGIPVHDADQRVHDLMAPSGLAFASIAKAFPEALIDGEINRQVLGPLVFKDPVKLKKLESILHPLVRAEETGFLKTAALRGVPLVVLDIPLLFETDSDRRCDAVVVVTAPMFIQRQRVMVRPTMTVEKFNAIIAKQMSDSLKRELADFIIQTGLGHYHALRDMQKMLAEIKGLKGRHWPRRAHHSRP